MNLSEKDNSFTKNKTNQFQNAFTGPKRVTKSHVPTKNAPIRIDIPEGKKNNYK